MSNYSIVEFDGAKHVGYKCGYCKSEDSNYSIGIHEINELTMT